jgi:hypothetical protein
MQCGAGLEAQVARPLRSRTSGWRRRTSSVSAAFRSAGSRRSTAAGSRAQALAALACAEIAGAKSEREHWEKGLGSDIQQIASERGMAVAGGGWARQRFAFQREYD